MWDVKYRPLVFSDVLGQAGTVDVLQARLREGKAFDTSYIFAGGHGCGKTTLARIFARAMLCQNPQEGNPCNECDHCKGCLDETLDAFTELDAASNGTTADMRQLVDGLAYSIPGVPKKIYLLDECHRMSRDGQDVLLKAIEEKRVVILFCTTELPKVRDTIKSRCETYEIRKIAREDILGRMKFVLESEGVDYEEDAVLTVIDLAEGHVRDVLNKLETVSQTGPITKDAVRDRLNLSVITTYYDILLSLGNAAQAISLVESACDRVGPTAVASGIAEAAMNAYRHVHGIHADFSHFDKDLAAKVHATFGDATPSLAEYFLRLNYVTKLHLICDVLKLCENGGAPVTTTAAAPMAPPVVVQASAVPVVTPPAPTPPPPVEAPTSPAPPPPAEKPPQAAPKPKASNIDPIMEHHLRADGKGPKGSSDPYALTKFDHQAVPPEMPRDDKYKGSGASSKKKLTDSERGSNETSALSPAEFRAGLLDLLRGGAQ